MPDFTFSELSSDLATDGADGLRNVANTAANFYCALYQADPLGVTGGLIQTPPGRAINALNTRLCSPRNIVPPPAEPRFEGGQCDIEYNVVVDFGSSEPNRVGNPTFPGNDSATYLALQGPITGTAVRQNVNGQGKRGVILVGVSVQAPLGEIVVWTSSDPNMEAYEGAFVAVSSVEPVGGAQLDICGNPAPSYNPYVAPVINFNTNAEVNFGLGLTANVPITIAPIIIAPLISIRPQISVDVGGITVNFNTDGVTFDFGDNGSSPIITPSPGTDPRTDPPPSIPPSGGGGGGGGTPVECPDPCDNTPVLDRLDDIDEALEELKDCACEKDYEIRVIVGEARNNARFVVPPRTLSVRLAVTVKGDRIKGEWGGGEAPDVEYMGWYSWRIDGLESDRRLISYEANTFEAPRRATGFSYTLRNNSIAVATISYEVEIVPT